MDFSIAGMGLLALWLVGAARGLRVAYQVVLCFLPFGMAAAVNVQGFGGLSILAISVAAALTTLLILVDAGLARSEQSPQLVSASSVFIVLLALYGILSAYACPRLFRNDFLVFAMSRDPQTAAGPYWSASVPLAPTASNVSQPLYLLQGALFFVASLRLLRMPAMIATAHKALMIAASIHCTLALIDALGGSNILAPIRTANYELLDGQMVGGLDRVIGGFSEASAFGYFSVALFAYFIVCAVLTGRWSATVIAAACGACAVASLSSTAFLGTGVTLLGAAFIWVRANAAKADFWQRFLMGCFMLLAALIVIDAIVDVLGLRDLVDQVLAELIYEKGGSDSALERGAWAQSGFDAFVNSWGLGAGLGSIRANGWLAVLLGNVGLPGLLLVAGFLWRVLVPSWSNAGITGADDRSVASSAARLSALAMLSMMAVSSTTLDFGLPFMLMAALTMVGQERPASGPVFVAQPRPDFRLHPSRLLSGQRP